MKDILKEERIVGKIFDRAAILKSVNESFDDFEKLKKTKPNAEIHTVGFFMASGDPEDGQTEVQASVGGDRRLLMSIALKNILRTPVTD